MKEGLKQKFVLYLKGAQRFESLRISVSNNGT